MDRQNLFNEYSDRQKFEHELINRRITWLLTSQTILFAAYGLGASKDNTVTPQFLKVVAWCGLLSSFFLFLGIVAGALAKCHSWGDYLSLDRLNNMGKQDQAIVESKLDELRRKWGVRTWITGLGLVPDLLLPLMFLGAWAKILWP
jgi:hypothetical protein